MKKVIVPVVVVSFISLFVAVYFSNKPVTPKQPSNQTATQIFDNSIAGLWEMSMRVEYPSQPSLNQEKTAQKCITQKEIEQTTKNSLEEKFNTKGLNCVSQMKRISNTSGQFELSCAGFNPVKQQKVTMKVNGSILSEAKKSDMKVDYEIKSGDADALKFSMTTHAKHIGACEEVKKEIIKPELKK